jgi:hypothetical protein
MATHGGLIIFHELHFSAKEQKKKKRVWTSIKRLFLFFSFFQMNTALHLSERANERRQGFTNLISCLQPPGGLKQ